MRSYVGLVVSALFLVAATTSSSTTHRQSSIDNRQFLPGHRALLDAHNAYPDRGRFADRIDVALATGLPVGDRAGPGVVRGPRRRAGAAGVARIHVRRRRAHAGVVLLRARAAPGRGGARQRDRRPTGRSSRSTSTSRPTSRHTMPRCGRCWASTRRWLTTAPRVADAAAVAPLQVGPVLVLTGSPDIQQVTFHDAVPVGRSPACLRRHRRHRAAGIDAGGAAARRRRPRTTAAGGIIRGASSRPKASAPPASGRRRMPRASRRSSPTRTRTASGSGSTRSTASPASARGGPASYNFGSLDAVSRRWRAAMDAKVDFIATDQYAEFARSRR